MPVVIKQANSQLAPVYQQATNNIQAQVPAIQQLYDTLIGGLQAQSANQLQNVTQSAAQRGVSSAGLTQGAQTGLEGALALQQGQLGVQQAGDIAGLQQQAAQTGLNRVSDAQALAEVLQKQQLAKSGNKLAIKQLNQKAKLEQLQNQQNYNIKVAQAQAQAAKQAAASAQAAHDAASKMSVEKFVSNLQATLINQAGGDGRVSNENFLAGLDLWTKKGLPPSEYYNTFERFIDRSHIQDYTTKQFRG